MKTDEIVNEIKQLEDVLVIWSNAYYDGRPIVSDAVFDRSLERLRELDPDHPLITKIGHGYIPTDSRLKKFHHLAECGSLPKLKLVECSPQKPWNGHGKENYVLTPKFDGGSVIAYYDEKGNLERVLSRGDGVEGFDITHNVGHRTPSRIDPKWGITSVRGEVIMSFESAEKLNASHPRNKAVGISQSLNSATEEEIASLVIVWYSIPSYSSDDKIMKDQVEILSVLALEEFVVPYYVMIEYWAEFIKYAETHDPYKTRIPGLKGLYPIDGLVLTDRNNVNKAVAVKFENEEVETIVNGIDWELSRTGRLVPVLEVKPVVVSGATVSRVTTNNATWLRERKCGVGSTVKIVRSNEVIPMLTEVIEESNEFMTPTHCPSCGHELVNVGVDLACVNTSCPNLELSVVKMILSEYSVDGIGPGVIDKLIEYEGLETINDLHKIMEYSSSHPHYKMNVDYWSGAFGEKTSEKIVQTLRNVFDSPKKLGDVLRLSNIPNIGKTFGKCVNSMMTSEIYDEFSAVLTSGIRENYISFIENRFKPCFTNYLQPKNLIANRDRIADMILLFDSNISIGFPSSVTTNEEKKMNNDVTESVSFCLTGKLSKKRDEVVSEFERFGHRFTSESSCDILIADAPSSSSKYRKAQSRGIPIMTEGEFREKYCV